MVEDVKQQIDGMTQDEQQRRLEEINRRLEVPEISGGKKPVEFLNNELAELREERDYLRKKLGQID